MHVDFRSLTHGEFGRIRPCVKPEAILDMVGADAVGWPPASAPPVHLDPITALVAQMLDGSVSVEQLAGEVADAIGVAPTIANARLRESIEKLHRGGLLDASAETGQFPTGPDQLFVAPPNP